MRIQHNIMAMNAYRNYNTNTSALSKNLEKLSSGYKINRAGDDAAGLAISEKMRAQITGLNAAQKNVKDGISLVKTAEGAMQEIQDMLNRMDYLATQSANGTYDNEVDRLNLQKEVDQLKSEINRIADSSNFNGIKLLDGKLGLNEDAFSFSAVAASEAGGGNVAGSSIAVNDANLHTEVSGNATQTAPALTIDLGSLAFDASGGDTAVKLNVFGKDFTLNLVDDGGSNSDGKYTTADIADALKEAIAADTTYGVAADDGLHDGTASNNDGVKLGDFVFTVGGTGGAITLTYSGLQTGTAASDFEAAGEFSTDQAKAINTLIGQGVKVSDAGTATQTNDVIHDTTNVSYAVAKTPSTLAGVDIDLTKVVGQGNTLTIDGKTYYFQTESTDPAVAGATKIDVSKGKTDEERLHMAVDLLSKEAEITGQGGRKWKIASAGGSKIHIDQTAGTTDTTKALKSYDDVAGVISATTPVVSAKNEGTKITITNDKVKEGDTLTIDGKVYVFADKDTTKIPDGATKVAIKGGAAKNLAALIDGSEFNESENTVIVRAATADDAAPKILGKGLQLQIGDTADSYNQLQVKIGDMHTDALGITDLNISNPESAASAIQTIRNAINYVSGIRGDLGATQNRLEHTANNLSVMAENIQDAESTIRDTDVAEEMMAYTKNNILVQSAQAMLAQANAVPQGVLQLLG